VACQRRRYPASWQWLETLGFPWETELSVLALSAYAYLRGVSLLLARKGCGPAWWRPSHAAPSLGVGTVKHGWYPATEALDRFGSAAVGDPVYEAGDSLGKLVRTLYLCDYFGNPVFRTEILDLLNQGEAVHSLQRAVYDGMITAKHGRTMEELGAISGALTLLANIVMAWNTHQLQIAIDRAPADYPDEVLSRIAPIGYNHINLRGNRSHSAWA
jgi:Tn3 transposase DDE domain